LLPLVAFAAIPTIDRTHTGQVVHRLVEGESRALGVLDDLVAGMDVRLGGCFRDWVRDVPCGRHEGRGRHRKRVGAQANSIALLLQPGCDMVDRTPQPALPSSLSCLSPPPKGMTWPCCWTRL
jgi:hypothetical protein